MSNFLQQHFNQTRNTGLDFAVYGAWNDLSSETTQQLERNYQESLSPEKRKTLEMTEEQAGQFCPYIRTGDCTSDPADVEYCPKDHHTCNVYQTRMEAKR